MSVAMAPNLPSSSAAPAAPAAPGATFVRLVELWRPSADGTLLEHAGGCYDAAPDFGALSRQMCFGRAEGLPGAAWDEGCPQLWAPLSAGRFVRARAAAEAGIDGALALPIHAGGRLTSVAVLFFASDGPDSGAVELWFNDARVPDELRLAEGFFGPVGEVAARAAAHAPLARGSGAPGLAWQTGTAVFIDDLAGAPSLLRAQAVAQSGHLRALALPCGTAGGQAWVVGLRSSPTMPIARRVEGWLVDRAAGVVRRGFGHCEHAGRLPADDGAGVPIDAMGPIGRAARSGAAELQCGGTLHAGLSAADASAAGLRSVLALPLPAESGVDEVVALYL